MLGTSDVEDSTENGGINKMHNHDCKDPLYRETDRSINSQEIENCGAVIRHGIIISTASTGNRVAIDMFATTNTCIKTKSLEGLKDPT